MFVCAPFKCRIDKNDQTVVALLYRHSLALAYIVCIECRRRSLQLSGRISTVPVSSASNFRFFHKSPCNLLIFVVDVTHLDRNTLHCRVTKAAINYRYIRAILRGQWSGVGRWRLLSRFALFISFLFGLV